MNKKHFCELKLCVLNHLEDLKKDEEYKDKKIKEEEENKNNMTNNQDKKEEEEENKYNTLRGYNRILKPN